MRWKAQDPVNNEDRKQNHNMQLEITQTYIETKNSSLFVTNWLTYQFPQDSSFFYALTTMSKDVFPPSQMSPDMKLKLSVCAGEASSLFPHLQAAGLSNTTFVHLNARVSPVVLLAPLNEKGITAVIHVGL